MWLRSFATHRHIEGPLALPGEHNRSNAGAALAALELAGVSRDEAGTALARFTGTGRRFEVHEGDFTIVDDYAHHPSEIDATIAAARERFPGARLRVLFQPHLYSRTRHLAAELALALAAADDVTVTDVYPAREEPVAGVSGKLVDRRAQRPGVLAACTPTVEQGAARLARRARPGTWCSFSVRATSNGLSACSAASVARMEESVPLARYTTIGTGGPARWFARPATIEQLQDVLRLAQDREAPVETIGLGSNVLAHDDGVDALVLKLDGELAAVESKAPCSSPVAVRRTRLRCTARAPPVSGASSSRLRSPVPPAAACG